MRSSITWLFDSPYRVSYWCSIGTPSPYLQAFSRYLAPNCLSNSHRHCACAISRDPYPLCKIWVHIWIFHPHIAYSQWHFYWAPMKIKGCLLVRPPMLNAKSRENFVPTKIGQILAVLGVWGSGVFKSCNFTPKKHMCSWIHVVWAILRQNRSRGVTSRSVGGKNKESHKDSHRKDMSPLTQCLNYRSACDPWPHIAYSVCNFHGSAVMIKGSLLMSLPIMKPFGRKFYKFKHGSKNWRYLGFDFSKILVLQLGPP